MTDIYHLRNEAVQATQRLLKVAEESDQALLYLGIIIARCGFADAVMSEIERIKAFDSSPEWGRLHSVIQTQADKYEVASILTFEEEETDV